MIAINPLSAPKATDQKAELSKAAKQFEAIFARQLLTAARKASLGDGLFDNKATEEFQSMQDSQFADLMAEHGGLGLAKTIEQQLSTRLGVTK
jgi:flagellar protein FlgJ